MSPAAYMEFIYDRLKDKNPDGSLQIMYTIHGQLISCSNLSISDDCLCSKGRRFSPRRNSLIWTGIRVRSQSELATVL